MSHPPLNGETVMTLESDEPGMLLVKPPSKHRCKEKEERVTHSTLTNSYQFSVTSVQIPGVLN